MLCAVVAGLALAASLCPQPRSRDTGCWSGSLATCAAAARMHVQQLSRASSTGTSSKGNHGGCCATMHNLAVIPTVIPANRPMWLLTYLR